MRNKTALLFTLTMLAFNLARSQGSLSTVGGIHLTHRSNGLLMPNVALVATNNPFPWAIHPAGMEVYNTATAGTTSFLVSPGLYVNDGTKWIISVASIPYASYTGGTLACGTLSGTYTQNFPMAASNTKTISITTQTVGNYTATTTQVNGVTFAASGTFNTVGTNMQVVLTASGIPIASGTFHDTVTLGGQVCYFDIPYTPMATFTCASAVQAQTQTDIGLVNNTSYSGSYTIPYTAGNGSSYPLNTITNSGLTLAHPAGVYSTNGNIVYTLSGTYNGTSGYVTFAIPECSPVTFGDAIYTVLSTGSKSLYAAASQDNWVSITQADFTALQTLGSAGAYGATNTEMGGTVTAGDANNYTFSLSDNQNLIPSNNYPIAVAFKTLVTSQSSIAGLLMKLSTGSIYGPYYTFPASTSATTPSSAYPISGNSMFYYVLRKPTNITASNAFMGYYLNNNSTVGRLGDGATQTYSPGNIQGSNLGSTRAQSSLLQMLAMPTKEW